MTCQPSVQLYCLFWGKILMSNKSQGLSVRVPLVYGEEDGPYILNKNIGDVVKQNLKNLILTNPGERPMIKSFGVGFHRLMFEPINSTTIGKIKSRILKQINIFMSFVNVEEIRFITSDLDPSVGDNQVTLILKYNIGDINPSDTLTITSGDD